MYKIGELSQLCGLPVKTLRYWTDIGLLVPDEIDRFTSYRYYSAARLADCHRIIALKKLGFTLDEIRRHMAADDPDVVPMLIEAKMAELRDMQAKLESQLTRLDAMRHTITKGETKMFDMVIHSEGGMCAAYERRIFADRADAVRELEKLRDTLPVRIIGRRGVIINYETEYRERDFDFAVCVELTGSLPAGCMCAERTLDFAGDTATLVCGSGELDAAYSSLRRQLEEQLLQIVGPYYEVYHDDGTVEIKVPVCRLSAPCDVADDEMEPFVNDPDAVGMWEFVDLVPSAEQFLPGHAKLGNADDIPMKKLCFLPDGGGYWIIRGWTRGKLYTAFGYPKHTFAGEYYIEERDGETYMFLALKNRYHARRGGRPTIYVYRRLDTLPHKADEMRIRDNVDLPFVPDERVIGVWKAVDCIRDRENFSTTERQFPTEGLFCKTLEFRRDGKAVQLRGNGSYTCDWTNGTLLERGPKLASAYELRKIDGREYLMVEWKSGDYVYAGRVSWYVYCRA